MATKIKTKTVAAIIDRTTAMEAMSIVGKPLKAVDAEFEKLASLPSEGKAQRGMCAAAFAWGMAMKKTGKPWEDGLFNDRFNAYAAKHWKNEAMPGEPVLRGYRSQYGAFCKAAFAKFDATPVVRECLSIANVQLPWRAARVREMLVVKDGDKMVDRAKAPSAKDIAETLKITAAAGTLAVREGSSVFLSLVNVLISAAGDKGLIKFLAENAQHGEWLQPAMKGAVDYRATEAASLKDGSKKQKGYRDSVRMAREAMLALSAKGGRAARRANVSATGHA
jgi:hypothetical protein